ncbi:pyruvate, water dikinase regulatory protein [Pectinatus frisingensis]|uniref:pyruvate, water dikinase regulatory protein n=1 Tax=Pectinatus frisingensis TaxID=865 RepID=UPI0018C6AC99
MAGLPVIYIVAESLGETAEAVVRAAASQFDSGNFEVVRVPYVDSPEQIDNTLKEAAKRCAFICHTLISPELRQTISKLAEQYNVITVDILGPMLQAVQKLSGMQPKNKPGLTHLLNRDYYRRIEAIEFAVKYDDGKSAFGLLKADLVLIGVSRTSKTPLSMYLAHKGLKVANVPLVPGIAPPEELFHIPAEKIVGLIVDPAKLNEIRTERLKAIGLMPDASYAKLDCISEEIEYSKTIMHQLQCKVINVSNRAIEETAHMILEHHGGFTEDIT